ncbi:MAG: hypothetical protein ABIT91_21025 [Gemmatimonadaceae bacterium]
MTTLLAVMGATATWNPALLIPALVVAYVVLGALLVAAEGRAPM